MRACLTTYMHTYTFLQFATFVINLHTYIKQCCKKAILQIQIKDLCICKLSTFALVIIYNKI